MASSVFASSTLDQPPPQVVVEFMPDHQQALVRLSGELDMLLSKRITDAFRSALSNGCTSLHLDVSGVSFLDASCFRQLLATQHQVEGVHIAFTVSASAPAIDRVAEIFGVRLDPVTGETAT